MLSSFPYLSVVNQKLCNWLKHQRQQNIQPVCSDAGTETADGVGTDGFADELAVAETVEHGGMSAEETAPAHADGGEHGDGVVVDDALGDEIGRAHV